MYGALAKEGNGPLLKCQVCQSNAGYYIGTMEDGMPYTRESAEYYPSAVEAQEALDKRTFTQRDHN